MNEVNGWLFPEEYNIPEHHWYTMEFGGRSVMDLNREGHLYLAQQSGIESVETTIEATGTTEAGLLYAVATATVKIDGEEWTAIGGADETSQQVRDPEFVWSVAGTRAIKRAVKTALGIRKAGDGPSPTDPETAPAENAPDGIDSPPSEWEESDQEPTDTDTEDGDLTF